MMTFYAIPVQWWWGSGLVSSLGARWNLAAALIFAAGVLLDGRQKSQELNKSTRLVFLLLLLYALDASGVHFLFADSPETSWIGLQGLWKQLGLLVLMVATIKDRLDLRIMIYSILLGSAYIGYEVVVNAEGHYVDGRLEGVFIAGAGGSNAIGALLSLALPLGGYLMFCGKRIEKCLAVVTLPLIVEVVLRCGSRAVFLALIGGAVWLIIGARGRLRKLAIAGVVLAVVVAFIQMGETDQIRNLGRFRTTFASADQRDSSAQRRLQYWSAALRMIGDHPLGSGFEAAFSSDLGVSYIRDFSDGEYHSVHNGYLDIAAGWGIQGLILYLGALFFAWRRVRCFISSAWASDNQRAAFLGCCIDAMLVVQLIASTFGSSLDRESFLWWIAMAVSLERAYGQPDTDDSQDEDMDFQEELTDEPQSDADTQPLTEEAPVG